MTPHATMSFCQVSNKSSALRLEGLDGKDQLGALLGQEEGPRTSVHIHRLPNDANT